MAQPFSPKQRDAIRERLKESARKYAVSTGVKKTSLDMLTADAGISKSSFYKFFSSKELLFLEIANDWEMQVIAAVNESLKTSVGTDDKRRAANMVYTAFTTIHALGICNFLCDDLPELARFIPEEEARSHYLSSAQGIFDMLHHAEIHAEGVLDERLAVARDCAGHDMHAVAAQLIELGELLADHVGRIALIGLVMVEQDLMVLTD